MKTIAYSYINPLLDEISQFPDWEVDRLYQDIGKRDQLEELMRDCRNNPPQRLLVNSLVELGDSLTAISDRLRELEELGIEVIAITQDYQSSQTKANLASLLSEIQKELHSRRLRHGHARNRIQAIPPPGKAPYGYRRGRDRYLIDRATAPLVKDFFEYFLLYGNLRKAVRYLEKKYGKKIAVSTGRNWLTNPVYRGHLTSPQGKIILNTHASLLSTEEAAQIDRLLRRNAILPPRTASASRSLAGLVVCQQCQSSMTITRVTRPHSQKEYLYVRPLNCLRKPKCRAIAYDQILTATIERICEDLPKAVAKLETGKVEELKSYLQHQISEKQAIITKIPDLETQGLFDSQTAQMRIYQLKTEIANLKAQIAQLPPVSLQAIAQTASLPEFWLDLSEAERRFYFREFIQQIQILRPHNDRKAWKLQLLFIF